MKKIICYLFGHKWFYFSRKKRECTSCKIKQGRLVNYLSGAIDIWVDLSKHSDIYNAVMFSEEKEEKVKLNAK